MPIRHDREIWVGIGSDHADRQVESYGVTVSKQVCAKPVGPDLWRYARAADHRDELILSSHVTVAGERKLDQQGPMSGLRNPMDLIALFEQQGDRFEDGTAMLRDPVGVHGRFQPSEQFDLELHDPALKRSLTHSYVISVLPIAD